MAKHRRDQRDEHRRQGNQHGRNHEEQRRQDDQHRPPHAGHPKPQRFNHLPSQALKRDQTTNGKRNLGQVVLAQAHFQRALKSRCRMRGAEGALSAVCPDSAARLQPRLADAPVVILVRQHGSQRAVLRPISRRGFAVREPDVPAVSTRRPLTPKDPLHHILFHVNGLDTLEGDVDFLTNEDALVHVKGAVVHVEGEAPKMKHRTQNVSAAPATMAQTKYFAPLSCCT